MKRRFDLYLKDIVDCINKIEEYTKPFDFEAFKASPITIDASVRNLEIIGEAVSQLSEEIKEKYSNVPWQDIKDFRNVVIHKYHSIDVEALWDIIKNKLNILRKQVKEITAKEHIRIK